MKKLVLKARVDISEEEAVEWDQGMNWELLRRGPEFGEDTRNA